MRKLVFLALALSGSSVAMAQDEAVQVEPLLVIKQQSKYAVKLYNVTTFDQPRVIASYPTFSQSENYDQYLSPAVALTITNRRQNKHEIEISDIKLETKDNVYTYRHPQFPIVAGEKHTTAGLALRYEYIVAFAKRKDWRLKPSLGFALQPFFTMQQVTPYITVNVKNTHTEIGLRTFLVPRINVDLCKRLFLDVNAPLCLLDARRATNNRVDPTLPVSMQKTEVYEVAGPLHSVSIRVGLGLNI